MTDLEKILSNLVHLPVSLIGMSMPYISESTGEKPEIEYSFTAVPDFRNESWKDPADDEIPFCDDDCGCCDLCDDEQEDEEEPAFWGIPDVYRIIFNPPATIVFWDDGTKTVVKCMEGEKFERYAGFAAACMKKMFGSTSFAKSYMNQCDQDTWKKWEEKENAKKNSSSPKKAEPKSKSISLEQLIDAFAQAVKTAAETSKENKDETPAE